MASNRQRAGDGSRQQQAGSHSKQYQIENNYFHPQTTLGKLLQQLELELENETTTSGKIDEFEQLMHFKTTGEFVGLEQKLKAGERLDLLEEAEDLKERIAKKITKHENIESAQRVYLYLLEDVITAFKYKVIPLIKANESHSVIDSAIKDNIIDPISEKLGTNSLDLFPRDVEGLIYFLIGNCHLKWG
ncbi:MAG: hypothetical protein KAG87_03235 [Marinobacter adhaerens]|nr:hypothetical protein [Marinobacter adhaerens]